jgi:hypothetical protein
MKFENIGFDEKFYADKSLEEFTKAFKGKIRSDKIKIAYDMIPKVKKVKEKSKPLDK